MPTICLRSTSLICYRHSDFNTVRKKDKKLFSVCYSVYNILLRNIEYTGLSLSSSDDQIFFFPETQQTRHITSPAAAAQIQHSLLG